MYLDFLCQPQPVLKPKDKESETMTIASQVKQCLANLKSAEAEMSNLALTSLDDNTKRSFQESAEIMEKAIEDLKKRVGELERQEFQYKGL